MDYSPLNRLQDERLRLWYRGQARVQPASAGKGLLTSGRVPNSAAGVGERSEVFSFDARKEQTTIFIIERLWVELGALCMKTRNIIAHSSSVS